MSTLLTQWLEHADTERIAVHDARGSHAYADVVARSLGVAASLLAEGSPGAASHAGRRSLEGERVAILVGPGASFVEAFFGVLVAGGCVVVLSPLHPAPETRYFCEDAGARTILVSAEHAALAAPLADAWNVRSLEPLLAHSDHAADSALSASARAIDDAAPALQLYTSGTTGKPKGAVITHGNLAVQQRLLGEAWGFSEADTLLHALPLHHMHGLAIALLTALGAGATIRMTTFDAPAIWEAMSTVTAIMAVPAMYHRLFAAFDAADDAARTRWSAAARALRLATSGSAALPATLAERWRAITGTIPLERFGMTEIGVGLTNRRDGARYVGCVGFPLPTVETRIVGDAGAAGGEDRAAAEDSDTGELWVRGPSVFAGYHGKPEETAKAFVPDAAGGAPWFRTGDTVTRQSEPDGSRPFKILGRTSVDILKSGGYKLSALEIEEVLREHPAVGEAAVIGIPDEAWGDRVVACIVRRDPGPPCDEASLRAFVRERLAAYKVPKDVVFLAELPKNAVGKVVKPALAALVQGGRAGQPGKTGETRT